MQPSSAAERVLEVYELLECIILQLEDIDEIIRAQRVCRTWRDVIRSSVMLQEACWYQTKPHKRDIHAEPDSQQTWTLNPMFNRIGILVKKGATHALGSFSLEKRMYDKPGSWTTMLAAQPPCYRMEISCYGDYSADENM